YKAIGGQINAGSYNPSREINHTHEGSLGNLCLEQISDRMKHIIQSYEFQDIEKAYAKLLLLS
ncbi:MAG TPA: argininosuccinate lyase, partial [Prolixibacteraceae bacterium]